LEGAPSARTMLSPDDVMRLRQLAASVHVQDEVIDYVVRLAAFTREHARVFLGASPRASLALMQAARARALMDGRGFVLPDDVKALAVPVLAHRLVLTPEAEMEGTRPERVVQQALEQVAPHRDG
ncbi:MAG: MoxR family ATPase, partial [Myxococcales bacterium]|nr:MoxR family ATPase [Myxococcales bacterium]